MTAALHQDNHLAGSKLASRFFASVPRTRARLAAAQLTATHLESVTFIYELAPECVVALEKARAAGRAEHAAKLKGLLKVIKRGGALMILLDLLTMDAPDMMGPEGIWLDVPYDQNGCPLPPGKTRKVWLKLRNPDGSPVGA